VTSLLDNPVAWLMGYLLPGALNTVKVTALAFLCGIALGLLFELARRSGVRSLGRAVAMVVEVLRAMPPVTLLFIAYFGVAELGLKLSPLAAGVLCLGLIEAAYATEIYRAGINAVHHGQREAALTIGMTGLGAMRHVVLPQAVRHVIPPLTNQCVGLLKTSAAVSLIALPDLTFEAQVVTGLTYQGLKVFGLAMLIYLALSLPVSWLARRLERRR